MIETDGNLVFEQLNEFNDLILDLRHDVDFSDEGFDSSRVSMAKVDNISHLSTEEVDNISQFLKYAKVGYAQEVGLSEKNFKMLDELSFFLLENARGFDNSFEDLLDILEGSPSLMRVAMDYADVFDSAEMQENCILSLVSEILEGGEDTW